MKRQNDRVQHLASGIARLALIGLVVAPSASHSEGYVGHGGITYMQSAYGGWILRTSGPQSNPDSCADGTMIILPPDHTQYKELFAVLLAARTAGETISIYVNGCHAAGYKVMSFIAVL